MAILISKEKYERLINLFKTDEDKAMNEMLEIFKNSKTSIHCSTGCLSIFSVPAIWLYNLKAPSL